MTDRELTVEELRQAVRRVLRSADAPLSTRFHDDALLLDHALHAAREEGARTARRAAIAECKAKVEGAFERAALPGVGIALAALDEVQP